MKRSGRLIVQSVQVTKLTAGTIDTMWDLYSDYYANVTRADFERDLAEKNTVFVGRDGGSDEVVGFSTALFYMHRFRGRKVGIYFSGDTIIHPSYWGQVALHRTVLLHLLRWRLRHPSKPLYWYLICSGYRTYLTLVRNFPHHWPHHQRATPEWETGLIDSISRARYPNTWQSDLGVISLADVQPILKPSVAPFTPAILELPEVKFFVQANPGHLRGDELAMIAKVDIAAVRQVLGRTRRRRHRRHRPAVRRTSQPDLSAS
jgi:hypothetical protein